MQHPTVSPGQPTRTQLRAPNHDPGLKVMVAPRASHDGDGVDLDEEPRGQAR